MEKHLKFKMSLGNISNSVHSLFFPATKNPNILIIFKEDSVFLWNVKTNCMIASFFKFSKKFKKILTADISYIRKLKIVFIAIGFESGCIQIWKIDLTKTTVSTTSLIGHYYPISCIKFDCKGFSLVSGCDKGDIVIWDIIQEKGEFRIKIAHEGKIKVLLFLNIDRFKDRCILSFGFDDLIKIWKIKKKIATKVIFIPERNISSINYNFKKNFLILISKKSQLNFYHISKNFKFSLIGKFWKNEKSFNFQIKIDRQARFLFVTNKDNQLSIFPFNDTTDLIQKKNIQNVRIQQILFKPVSFFFEFKIFGIDLWSNKDNKEITILIHYLSQILQLYKFSELLSYQRKNKFLLQKVCKSELEHHNSEIREIIWFKNNHSIVALCGMSKSIHIWCLNSKRLIDKISTASHGLCLVLCGKKNLIVGNKEGSIEIYDILSKKLLWSQSNAHEGPIWSLDIAKNQLIIATAGGDGILKLWEFETKEIALLKILNLKEQILCVKLIPKENIIILCTLSSTISVFFLNNLQFSFNLQGHKLPVICLAIRDDYNVIASGSADTAVRIWDLKHKTQKKLILTNQSAVTAIEFQAHTGNLFTASRCGSISFWRDMDYNLIYRVEKCHLGSIWTLKSSINGKFMASGSHDKSVKIWKIMTNFKKNNQFNIKYNGKITDKYFGVKHSRIVNDFKKTFVLSEVYNFLNLNLTNYNTKQKNKILDWNFFFINFLQLTKKEIIELFNYFNFQDNINILTKITKSASNKNIAYNFEFCERIFFFFKLIKNQIPKKKSSTPFYELKKELIKIINNIETDNKIIKIGLSSIKKILI
jgi:WD40 repeat protein